VNPFFFGSSARQLFGVYEAPGQSHRGAVVLCPPLGNEYLYSHPTYRLLSRMLTDAGFHVLRFDYFGTGDSAGEFEDTDQKQWLSDISTAADELKDLSGMERVSLVGLRYGGTLAALTSRARRDIDRLVLWNPVINGRSYLSEFDAKPTGRSGEADVSGVVVTSRIRHDIEQATTDTFGPNLPSTLILVTTDAVEQYEALRGQLAATGADASLRHVPDVPAWLNSHLTAAAMPVAALRAIVTWMS
jgi:pimeloyl-ACP methyl ester carboxylesterase